MYKIKILPRRKFVQVSCSDRYGHLYFELDITATFGHRVVVATITKLNGHAQHGEHEKT